MTPLLELVVVGGGPGGLAAALAAARAGVPVTLLDAYPRPGGQYYRQPPDSLQAHATARQKAGRALWQAVQRAGVEIRPETVVWDLDGEKRLSVQGPNGLEQLRAQRVILATGAYERLAAFPGWTLPGVITSGAAQILLYQQVTPGSRVLVAGTGPLQLVTAAHLVEAGVQVAAVLEGARLERGVLGAPALWGQWERLREGAESLLRLARHTVPYRSGWGLVSAQGSDHVESATIARLDRTWRPIPGTEQRVACDTVCVGYGLVPFNTLAKLAGARQAWRPELGGETPIRDTFLQTSQPGIYAAGDGAGIGGYRMAMLEGEIAGLHAAQALGYAADARAMRRAQERLKRETRFQSLYARLFTPGPGIYELAAEDTLVCRCEGVTYGKLSAAVRAGATTTGEVKSATRCGMGECQGRVCGHPVMHTIARLTGKPVEQVGAYSARPPVFPLPIGMITKT